MRRSRLRAARLSDSEIMVDSSVVFVSNDAPRLTFGAASSLTRAEHHVTAAAPAVRSGLSSRCCTQTQYSERRPGLSGIGADRITAEPTIPRHNGLIGSGFECEAGQFGHGCRNNLCTRGYAQPRPAIVHSVAESELKTQVFVSHVGPMPY